MKRNFIVQKNQISTLMHVMQAGTIRPKKSSCVSANPTNPILSPPTLQILLANWLKQSWKNDIKLLYHQIGTAILLAIEQFWRGLMEMVKNEHFNQCFHEIIYKIKK